MDYETKYKEANDKVATRFGTNVAKEIFSDLYESEDEKIRKEIIAFLKYYHTGQGNCVIYNNDWIAWLEKQGQKPINDTDEDIVEAVKDTSILDMVEPMFKAGDYIKHNKANIICKIISVNSGSYYVENIETNGEIELFNAEQNFHLWSIKDAKPGDVLAEDSCIFIIQKLGDNNTAAKTYCTLYDDGDFDDGTILYFDIDSTKPATKEQRDLLFKKMKESGYERDAEKKELKKIHVIDEGKAEMDYCFTKMMNGEKVGSAWSAEDEFKVQSICKYLNEAKKYYADIIEVRDCIDWLKSLKQRIEG